MGLAEHLADGWREHFWEPAEVSDVTGFRLHLFFQTPASLILICAPFAKRGYYLGNVLYLRPEDGHVLLL